MAKMEQFDKWCDKIEYFCVDYTKRDSMRRGWKAALAFVLDHRYSDTDESLYDILQRELGNDN